jgi:myo-inositol-1(or 4)-monophosphatase
MVDKTSHHILETDVLKIKKAVIQTGRRLKELMYQDDPSIFQYKKDNVAGHKSLGIDLLAEDLFVENLNHSRIGGQVISEESGLIELDNQSDSVYTLILDPLDGSTNFRRGIPFNCISVAFMPGITDITLESLQYGLIYDFNSGNQFEIHASEIFFNGTEFYKSLNTGPRAISYYYSQNAPHKNYPFETNTKIRTLGCAALELVYVAYGGFDGFIDVRGGLGTYDFAVAAKYVRLMGGHVTVMKEDEPIIIPNNEVLLNDIIPGYKLIAARSKDLHDELLSQLYPDLKK